MDRNESTHKYYIYMKKVSKMVYLLFLEEYFLLIFRLFLFQNYFEDFVYKVSYEVIYDKITIITPLHI